MSSVLPFGLLVRKFSLAEFVALDIPLHLGGAALGIGCLLLSARRFLIDSRCTLMLRGGGRRSSVVLPPLVRDFETGKCLRTCIPALLVGNLLIDYRLVVDSCLIIGRRGA